MSKLLFSERAWEDYQYWLSTDKKTARKINELLKDTERNGYSGLGKPEPLKGNLSGFWSKRIDDENRLVFHITEDTIEIIQLKGHYND